MTNPTGHEPQIPRRDPRRDAPALSGESLLAYVRRMLDESEDKAVRRNAALALRDVDHPDAESLLIELTRDPDMVLMLRAVDLLTERRSGDGFEAIVNLIDSGRRYAVFFPRLAHSLVSIDPCRAIGPLLGGLHAGLSTGQKAALIGGLRSALRHCPDGLEWLLMEMGQGRPHSDAVIAAQLTHHIGDLPLAPLLAGLKRCADRSLAYNDPTRTVLRKLAIEVRNRRPGAARAAVELLEALEAR